MAEVMNRAARRAAGMGRTGKAKVTVKVSNRIDVVPMEHVETYFRHEIASEGKWASGRVPMIIRPTVDAGRTDGNWFPMTLERMRETRRRKGTLPVSIGQDGGSDMQIDVGLVDVIVFFEMPPDIPPSLPTTREEFDMAFTENFRRFDSVCAGALHDQMIVASVPHFFHSNGSPLFHYHNLIFGLRQEVRGDMDILGPLDMEPFLKALSKSGPLSFIGGMKQ
jgi:hypothetical protein